MATRGKGPAVPDARRSSDQRLSLIVETQREIAAAGDELETVMQLIAERSQAITGAQGAMVNLVDGTMLHTRAVTGIAVKAFDARRPIAGSVARFAIDSGQPVLVDDAPSDRRINQELRAELGDECLICVPLFHGSEVIGTLNVMSRVKCGLDEEDRDTLEILSVVLSAAVGRAAEVEARKAQSRALARFRTLFDSASIGILRLDGEGRALEVNPALEQMLGIGADQLVGLPFSEHVAPEHRDSVNGLFGAMTSGERDSFALEIRCAPAPGRSMWAHLRAVLERGEGDQASCTVAMVENITERKRAERELIRQAELNEHQALHDPLTGLPNRILFGERIDQAIRHAQRNGTLLAVALMDLDRFKEVNDSLGHPAGDQLLTEVSRRMREAIRASDTVARLGGDEFGLLLPELHHHEDVAPVVRRIRSALERPIEVQGLPVAIEASIGVAIFPHHGENAQILIQRADVAMYDAKRDNSAFTAYDEDSHEYDVNRLTLVAELRRAISERELLLHYQPKAALANGNVTAVEALIRWAHPQRGLVYPDAFIPLAQETSLIGPLTLYVIEEALRQGREWREQGLKLAVSVNLSTRNLLDTEFPTQLKALLARWEADPDWLELEVTESSMLANPTRAKTILTELSELGIRLSIDDFGTGYSSLSYLRQLPVDEIKIDRSFVINMGEQAGDAVIVRSTVDLGRNLGLDVVAEGVESLELWNRLRDLGCNIAQGYFLSHPLPGDQVADWLKSRRLADSRAA
jgi:diguanylate cyclase (GGDEF)-like protein/PAS domain S-box-containing protein